MLDCTLIGSSVSKGIAMATPQTIMVSDIDFLNLSLFLVACEDFVSSDVNDSVQK